MKQFTGYMTGINIGGWLSQCEYSYTHYDSFFGEDDIARIAAAGFDHIRLPVDIDVLKDADGNYSERGFGYIDRCVEWCEKHSLNLIIDLHKAEGFAFYQVDKSLFGDAVLQNKFVALWQEFARRYSGHGHRVAFELLNEIVEPTSERWNSLLARAVAAIREISSDAYIIIGGIQWNSPHTLDQLVLPEDDNIILNFHFYEPFLFTHQRADWVENLPRDSYPAYPGKMSDYRALAQKVGCFASGLMSVDEMGEEFMLSVMKPAIEQAEKRGMALYCGEYGVICNAPAEDALAWYRDMNSVFRGMGIGRAAWTYKSMSFGLIDDFGRITFEDFAKVMKG